MSGFRVRVVNVVEWVRKFERKRREAREKRSALL